ncbi:MULTISPECIES: SH3 domain-containing protein [Leeia]|uniref:SH3 domain-containing protein n=1 Tax=Leeia aquatica TaxID=2725557 RepID=A0A847S309_9NEIS|nr:SH3 domain-containing protein [Leeia aquatica]NLR76181.1 SH3 domain-containing protein [Leeia aquatica]
MNRMPRLLAGALLVTGGLALAAPATVTRSSDLKAKPQLDAPTIATLSANSEVDATPGEGRWVQVKTSDGKSGWVNLMAIRFKSTASGNAGAGLAQVLGATRSGSTSSASTTGAKAGKDDPMAKADIQNATPNPADVAQMERYAVSANEARQIAQANRLKAQKVDYLKGGQ